MGNVLFSGNAPLDESRLRPFWDVIPAGLTALLVANLLLMGKLATARIVLSTRDELDKEPQNEQLDTSRSSNEWHLLFQKVEMAALATKSDSPFAKDLKDLHLVYDYNVRDAQGNPEKWRYEIWFFSEVNPFLQIIFADSDLSSPSMVESRSIQDPRWADGRPDQFPDMLLPMHQAGRALAVQLARRYDSASEALSPIAIVATTDGSYSLQRRALSSPLCKILPRNEERRSSLSPKVRTKFGNCFLLTEQTKC